MNTSTRIILIVGITIVCIGIGTLIRYFTRTGVFKGRRDKGPKK